VGCQKDTAPTNSTPNNPSSFSYTKAGYLVPSSSGEGRKGDEYIYAPNIRFPLEKAPAYINSQVYGVGGYLGPNGSLCDKKNYQYPWHDNYCEKRSWGMPLCPRGKGHQGDDIRASTCEKNRYYAVAVERGTITHIGSYSVYLRGESGRTYRYLHLSSNSLKVRVGERVSRGQKIGLVSNNMGSTPTSIHLHFDVKETILVNNRASSVYIPIYTSLVDAYKRLLLNRP
jgi:murein DD-endopeptidase MepM/ murein hydrolase activator NlpD